MIGIKNVIAIVCGGGPAPGINSVISGVVNEAHRQGWDVLGIYDGFSRLARGEKNYIRLEPKNISRIHLTGGCILKMSRFNPTKKESDLRTVVETLTELGVTHLVTIGGDDTASTANRIGKFLREKKYPVQNIHVPKTIDNDLPLPMNAPTFGYNSAKAEGARIATTVYEDARTSGNWFIVSAMGRSAGHLAMGIGASCHYPMIIIPEMFNKTEITVDKILRLSISAIVKRRLRGIAYGGIIVSEGVFHMLSDEQLKETGIKFTYDDHGHPELGKISKAQLFNDMLEIKLKELGLKVKTRPVEIGYDIRCQQPIAYDLFYCSQLGAGVYELFQKGETGCMVFVDQIGTIRPLYLEELQDPETGKIPPRLVDIEGDQAQVVFKHLLNYITPRDYEGAKQYVPNPEEYDFYKILNWER